MKDLHEKQTLAPPAPEPSRRQALEAVAKVTKYVAPATLVILSPKSIILS